MPFAFTERKHADNREGDDRGCLEGGKDILERSLALQQCVRDVYLKAAETDSALKVVSCDDGRGGMDTPDAIFSRIRETVTPLIR